MPAWERALRWAVLLGVLVICPAAGGRTVWFHTHGEHDEHVHVAPEPIPLRDGWRLHDWHARQHPVSHADREDGDERAHGDGGREVPNGIRILGPVLVPASLAQARAAAAPALGLRMQAFAVQGGRFAPSPVWLHRPELYRSGWPPQRVERSGLVALLRSSHALLI